jgi:hypothetical protein
MKSDNDEPANDKFETPALSGCQQNQKVYQLSVGLDFQPSLTDSGIPDW